MDRFKLCFGVRNERLINQMWGIRKKERILARGFWIWTTWGMVKDWERNRLVIYICFLRIPNSQKCESVWPKMILGGSLRRGKMCREEMMGIDFFLQPLVFTALD